MILFFCNDFSGDADLGSKLIIEKLKCEHILINPHGEIKNIQLVQQGSSVLLSVGKKLFHPETIFLSKLWRTDCLINTPNGYIYPGAYRSRVNQFLQDIRFAFEKSKWLPGKLESIDKAESKPTMFKEAFLLGIQVPAYTVNAFTPEGGFLNKHSKTIFRKNLGYPFTITTNTEIGQEIALTTTNELVDLTELNKEGFQPWQWQEPIKAKRQIRSFISTEKTWSVCWEKQPKEDFIDLRKLNQIEEVDIQWIKYQLPVNLESKMYLLLKKLGINFASPEFLVDDQNNHILIDLNPCGDWFGFFDDNTHEEISKVIANIIQ